MANTHTPTRKPHQKFFASLFNYCIIPNRTHTPNAKRAARTVEMCRTNGNNENPELLTQLTKKLHSKICQKKFYVQIFCWKWRSKTRAKNARWMTEILLQSFFPFLLQILSICLFHFRSHEGSASTEEEKWCSLGLEEWDVTFTMSWQFHFAHCNAKFRKWSPERTTKLLRCFILVFLLLCVWNGRHFFLVFRNAIFLNKCDDYVTTNWLFICTEAKWDQSESQPIRKKAPRTKSPVRIRISFGVHGKSFNADRKIHTTENRKWNDKMSFHCDV